MLKRSILAIAMSTSLYAMETNQIPVGNIVDLNSTYTSPSGTGHAKIIDLSEIGKYQNPKLEVENSNGVLLFSLEDNSFEIDISMFGITDAEQLTISDLNYEYSDSKFLASITSIDANDPEFKISVNKAAINCRKSQSNADVKDDLLTACSTNSTIDLSHASFQSDKNEFVSIVDEEILGSAMTIDDFQATVSNKNFKAQLKGNVTKNLKVKLEGSTSYDSNGNVLTIKITKAKAGFINVKNILFNELQSAQGDNMVVNNPYIYLTFPD